MCEVGVMFNVCDLFLDIVWVMMGLGSRICPVLFIIPLFAHDK